MTNQVFGLIAIAVGIGIGIYFAWAMKRQLATSKWTVAKGQVLESRIQDNGSSLEPYVKYTYFVRGKAYISDKISPNRYVIAQPASASSLNRMIAPYPAGKTITVYFDPQNPQAAVLERSDWILGNIVILMVSLLFIFFGFGIGVGK